MGRCSRLFARGLAPLLIALGLAASASALSPARVWREASPGVVVVFGFDAGGAGSSGTGSVIASTGLVLTNHHVVYDRQRGRPYENLQVYFKPERLSGDNRQDLATPHAVRVVARDEALDLALLQIRRPPPDLTVVSFGDSEEVEIGASVAAIGHPGGGGLWTLTTGTISSARREGERDIFQTDTAINPGNSGGPLLDDGARLIGINTFVRRMNAQGLPLEGLNYSLRSSVALAWLRSHGVELVASKRPARSDAPARPEADGGSRRAPVEGVAANDPPAEAVPSPDRRAGSTQAHEPRSSSGEPGSQEPHTFRAQDGSMMFGVPNRNFRLDAAMKAAYKKTLKNAGAAFDALDREELDDGLD